MKAILGKKVGMTQIFDEHGDAIPVTVIEAGPCYVTQVRTVESDGYSAVQLGFEETKLQRLTKGEKGHLERNDLPPLRYLREFRVREDELPEEGQKVLVDVFEVGDFVDVVGRSKGRGFAGVMKRHGFGGFPASHGTERKHRAPGSISSFASNAGTGGGPKRGKRMAGHMGNRRITSKNHSLVAIDEEKNLLIVKGAVPGPAGGYCMITTAKRPQ